MAQLDERIGDAWQQHRNGNHKAAVDAFESLLKDTPQDMNVDSVDKLSDEQRSARLGEMADSVDAMYGLGLATRANGDDARSLEIFQDALALTNKMLKALGVDDISAGRNELNSFEDDRFVMMRRMLSQRVEEMQDDEG